MQTDSNSTPPAVHSCTAYSDPFFAFPLRAMLARCVVAVGLEQVATASASSAIRPWHAAAGRRVAVLCCAVLCCAMPCRAVRCCAVRAVRAVRAFGPQRSAVSQTQMASRVNQMRSAGTLMRVRKEIYNRYTLHKLQAAAAGGSAAGLLPTVLALQRLLPGNRAGLADHRSSLLTLGEEGLTTSCVELTLPPGQAGFELLLARSGPGGVTVAEHL